MSDRQLKTENPKPKTGIDRWGVLEEEPFSFRATKNGTVFISWHGKTVTTLKGKPAEVFLAKVAAADAHAAQLVMAKATGNFKHGNERQSHES